MNLDPRRPGDGADSFSYTYSAREQAEIKKLRDKYRSATPERASTPDKMTRLRELDASVTRKGTILSLVVGILSALVMGTGMSLVMTDLKYILGAYHDKSLLVGIIIGAIGMVGVILAYPLYHAVTEKERRRLSPEIRRLCEELLGENHRNDSTT